jgi:mannose/fructose/N-acetylgalactosamine-specific phosphotransferase system component IIC
MHWLWAGLAGAIVYLDTTAVGQFMIGQPLIACPLFGLLVGRPEIGLFFGVTFQLLWLGSLPVGAAKFPEGNIGALVATALAASAAPLSNGDPAWIVLAVAAAIGILTAHFGAAATTLLRKMMNGYTARVVHAAEDEKSVPFSLLFSGAVGLHAATGAALTIAALCVGNWILTQYVGAFAQAGISAAIVAQTDRLLHGLWPALLGVGAMVLARQFVKRTTVLWYALAAATGVVAGWLWL